MNSNVIELLQNCIDHSSGENQYLKEYLESCLELGVFQSKSNAELVVKIIHSCLNSTFNKEKGLVLLLGFLPQISIDTYSNNAVSWMIQCNKFICQKGENIDDLSLKVLTKLIRLSVKFPEINRETAKEIIPKFLLEHVKRRSNSQISVEFLECLQACLSEYSGPSGDFKTDILRLLLSVVERPPDVVRAAACCVPLVAQVGGGGKLGITHKTNWRSLQLGLVALLHKLLNKIYQHIDCISQSETNPPEDPALTLEYVQQKNALLKTQRLTNQFVSVAHYLQNMLLQEFSVAKSVAPDTILDVISHAQKPTHSTLGISREALAVMSALPSIQKSALNLLEALILCLGRNLVSRAGLINHLCSQVIVWTHKQHQDWPYAMDKPYSETRLAAYNCVQSWLTVAGAACGAETTIGKALPVFLSDIHARKPTVRLTVGSKPTKKKKKQQMLVNVEDRSEKLGDTVANRNLCEKALLTLVQLVQSAGPYLDTDILMSIQDTVLVVSTELPVPYGASTCRKMLYQLLLALCLVNHPRVPPPLHHAIAVFTSGVHHPDPLVKDICSSALCSLEKIVHPTAATLNFAPPHELQKHYVQKVTEQENDSDIEEVENVAKKKKIDVSVDTVSLEPVGSDDTTDINSSVRSLKVEVAEEKIDSLSTIDIICEESLLSIDTGISKRISNESTVSNMGTSNEIEQRISVPLVQGSSTNEIIVPVSEEASDLFQMQIQSIPKDIATDDADVSEMLMDFHDVVDNK